MKTLTITLSQIRPEPEARFAASCGPIVGNATGKTDFVTPRLRYDAETPHGALMGLAAEMAQSIPARQFWAPPPTAKPASAVPPAVEG